MFLILLYETDFKNPPSELFSEPIAALSDFAPWWGKARLQICVRVQLAIPMQIHGGRYLHRPYFTVAQNTESSL